MAKVANIDSFKNFPGWNPVEKHKNHGQNQKASHMEPFGGNLWHCVGVRPIYGLTPPTQLLNNQPYSFLLLKKAPICIFESSTFLHLRENY